LKDNVQVMRDTWEVDVWRVAEMKMPVLGFFLRLGQRIVRRLTWWYTLPQAQQISQFHAASVRTTDAVLARILELSARLQTLEHVHSEQRLQLLEEQLRDARYDQQKLLHRVAELEARIAEITAGENTPQATDQA
jgi:hypothetical protein